jgi:hypothetical protein
MQSMKITKTFYHFIFNFFIIFFLNLDAGIILLLLFVVYLILCELDASSSGNWVINLSAHGLAVVQFATQVQNTDNSASVISAEPSGASQATERRHSESEDDVLSVDSSADEAEASSSKKEAGGAQPAAQNCQAREPDARFGC